MGHGRPKSKYFMINVKQNSRNSAWSVKIGLTAKCVFLFIQGISVWCRESGPQLCLISRGRVDTCNFCVNFRQLLGKISLGSPFCGFQIMCNSLLFPRVYFHSSFVEFCSYKPCWEWVITGSSNAYGAKSVLAPLMTQFSDSYMHHFASMI